MSFFDELNHQRSQAGEGWTNTLAYSRSGDGGYSSTPRQWHHPISFSRHQPVPHISGHHHQPVYSQGTSNIQPEMAMMNSPAQTVGREEIVPAQPTSQASAPTSHFNNAVSASPFSPTDSGAPSVEVVNRSFGQTESIDACSNVNRNSFGQGARVTMQHSQGRQPSQLSVYDSSSLKHKHSQLSQLLSAGQQNTNSSNVNSSPMNASSGLPNANSNSSNANSRPSNANSGEPNTNNNCPVNVHQSQEKCHTYSVASNPSIGNNQPVRMILQSSGYGSALQQHQQQRSLLIQHPVGTGGRIQYSHQQYAQQQHQQQQQQQYTVLLQHEPKQEPFFQFSQNQYAHSLLQRQNTFQTGQDSAIRSTVNSYVSQPSPHLQSNSQQYMPKATFNATDSPNQVLQIPRQPLFRASSQASPQTASALPLHLQTPGPATPGDQQTAQQGSRYMGQAAQRSGGEGSPAASYPGLQTVQPVVSQAGGDRSAQVTNSVPSCAAFTGHTPTSTVHHGAPVAHHTPAEKDFLVKTADGTTIRMKAAELAQYLQNSKYKYEVHDANLSAQLNRLTNPTQIPHNLQNQEEHFENTAYATKAAPNAQEKGSKRGRGRGQGQPRPRNNRGRGGTGGAVPVDQGRQEYHAAPACYTNEHNPVSMQAGSIASPMGVAAGSPVVDNSYHQEAVSDNAQPAMERQMPKSYSPPIIVVRPPNSSLQSPPSALDRRTATNDVWPTRMPATPVHTSASTPASSGHLTPDSLCLITPPQQTCLSDSTVHEGQDAPEDPIPEKVKAQELVPEIPLEPVEPPPPPRKRKLAEGEEGEAVCHYCGAWSRDLDNCESCRRRIPGHAKLRLHTPHGSLVDTLDYLDDTERRRTHGGGKLNSPQTPSSTANGPTLDKKAFYGHKQRDTPGAAFADKMEELQSEFCIQSTAQAFTRSPRGRRARGRSPRGSGTPRRSKKAQEVPVTVTISSSDEEEEGQIGDHPISQGPPLTPAAAPAQAPADPDDFFPASSTNSSKPLQRGKMQDWDGSIPKPKKRKSETGEFLIVRGVRIGSMRTEGIMMKFMKTTIKFKVRSERSQEVFDFEVHVTEITGIRFILRSAMPLMFLDTTQFCGRRLENRLQMDGTIDRFRPGKTENSCAKDRCIVVIIEEVLEEAQLMERLRQYQAVVNTQGFLHKLDSEEANRLLVDSTPLRLQPESAVHRLYNLGPLGDAAALPGMQAYMDQDEEEPEEDEEEEEEPEPEEEEEFPEEEENPGSDRDTGSPVPTPVSTFSGPVERLLQYPTTGKGCYTVTNRDTYCLKEGELLNDVIIDFFLSYLYFEKLTKEQQQKTYIFNSFFYARLNQKSRDPDAPKLPMPERRHARVKKWTSKVDIFKKDFLIIPMNEKNHWWLAVVCFPGQSGQNFLAYCGPPNSDANADGNADAAKTENEDSDAPALGKVIPHEKAMQTKSPFKIGLKQPCIMMFDSLGACSKTHASHVRILREYLQEEWKEKRGTSADPYPSSSVKGIYPKVPMQPNSTDCGIYLMQFAESFFEDPIVNFSHPVKLGKWFSEEFMMTKRQQINEVIMTRHQQWLEGTDFNKLRTAAQAQLQEAADTSQPAPSTPKNDR